MQLFATNQNKSHKTKCYEYNENCYEKIFWNAIWIIRITFDGNIGEILACRIVYKRVNAHWKDIYLFYLVGLLSS